MENMEYGQQRLKDIVEKEAEEEEEAKEQQQDEKVPPAAKEQQQDDEQYDTFSKMNWCTKENA